MRRVLRLGRLIALIVVSAAMAACASTGAVPRPFPMPGAAPPAPTPPTSLPPGPGDEPAALPPDAPAGEGEGYAIAGTALALRGVPYRNGGTDPSGFDCSGLVQYVFARYGVAVPREVRTLYRAGTKVDRDEVEPGDLVFFSTVARGASHVGIALGGDEFVHAPSSSGVVRVEHLSADYWSRRYIGARRMNQ